MGYNSVGYDLEEYRFETDDKSLLDRIIDKMYNKLESEVDIITLEKMERNRAWRRHQLFRNWHRRLRNEFRWDWHDCENIDDMKEHRYYHGFKTMGKPCSCYSCAGPYYRRLNYKFESDRIIREELYGDISHQTPRGNNKKIVDWD